MSEALTDWKHQAEALGWLNGRTSAMLAMDMGTGKSRVVIRWLDEKNCDNALILCPKVVLSVWPDQFKLHSDREWFVHAIDPKHSVAKRTEIAVQKSELAKAMNRPFALCVNYDAAWREPMATFLKGHFWDAGIWDESHRIKSAGGKASRFVSLLRKHSTQRRVALTGTPMPHSPLDLYAQWRALDTNVFGTSHQRFKSRYAVMGGYEGRQVVAFCNLDELMDKAGAGTFKVEKSDVLDLPPVTTENVPVELSSILMKSYQQFERDLVLEIDRGLVTADNALVKLLRLQQITSGYIKDDDGEVRILGTEKQDALYDLLEDMPQDEPIVVFARFHHDLDAVQKVAESQHRTYVELSGRANGYEIWKKGYGHVLGVQIQSGGVGIDLTRSAYAVYYSVGFSLGDYQQSLARLDRPGQTRPVTVYHLITRDTVDAKVYRALATKKNVVNEVLRGFGYGYSRQDTG